MPTTVVNRHHKVPYDIYIGRGSEFGNPYSHMQSTRAEFIVESREEAIEKYLDWFFEQRHLFPKLKELKGKSLGCYCSPSACHGDVLALLADTTWYKDDKLILECSSKGDTRFSAFFAAVEIFGISATIEEHYQLSKRFINGDYVFVPTSIYDVKGKNSKTRDMELGWITVNGFDFPAEFRLDFYKWMWLQFLDQNQELVAYAKRFDDYNDIFKGKSGICQADCIRQYIQQGRESMVADVELFCDLVGVSKSYL